MRADGISWNNLISAVFVISFKLPLGTHMARLRFTNSGFLFPNTPSEPFAYSSVLRFSLVIQSSSGPSAVIDSRSAQQMWLTFHHVIDSFSASKKCVLFNFVNILKDILLLWLHCTDISTYLSLISYNILRKSVRKTFNKMPKGSN